MVIYTYYPTEPNPRLSHLHSSLTLEYFCLAVAAVFFCIWLLLAGCRGCCLPSQISKVVYHIGSIRKLQDDLENITCLWSKFCKCVSVQNSDWLERKLMKSMRTGNRVLYEWKCWRTVIFCKLYINRSFLLQKKGTYSKSGSQIAWA